MPTPEEMRVALETAQGCAMKRAGNNAVFNLDSFARNAPILYKEIYEDMWATLTALEQYRIRNAAKLVEDFFEKKTEKEK